MILLTGEMFVDIGSGWHHDQVWKQCEKYCSPMNIKMWMAIYPVRLVGHFTSEVYDFCESTHGLILPTKGERTLATPYVSKPVEFYPG